MNSSELYIYLFWNGCEQVIEFYISFVFVYRKS